MKKLVLSLAVVLGVGTMVSCGGSKTEEKDSVCTEDTCVKEECPVVEENDSVCNDSAAADTAVVKVVEE